ncbi:MAG: peptidase M48 Ste24p, partial [Verrucomicrobia bacterium]
PSGTIIVTDALVHLLNDDELAAVFAHEIAHIDQRHGVRLVLQNSGVFIVIGTLLGDINSLSGMAGTLPMVLIGSGYSREFEAEADLAAARYLLATRGTTAPMRSALARLLDNAANASMPYLSSHPETEERIEALLEFEKNHKPLSAGRTSDD